MDIKLIFGALTLHFFALISPGPDFVLALRNTLQFGRLSGLATAIGFGLGIGLHVSYCIAGVALLLQKFPSAFGLIKYAGAIYLIWIGTFALWDLRRSSEKKGQNTSTPVLKKSFFGFISQGFLTNILNPKATLFILSIYTSVLKVDTGTQSLVMAGAGMVLLTILWFSLVSWFFGNDRIRRVYLKFDRPLGLLFGLFFVVVGVLLVAS